MITYLTEFVYLYLQSLENYSKGKSVYIQVNSKKVVRKRSKEIEDDKDELKDFIEKDEEKMDNKGEGSENSQQEDEEEKIINERPLFFEN